MKNIAVLVHGLTVEYSVEILNGISDYFKDKTDYWLIFAQTKDPRGKFGIAEYQYWSSQRLMLADGIDGIIILSGSYSQTVSDTDLANYLKDFAKTKPVVSIGVNLEIQNCYYTHVNTESVYDELLSHMKNEHGCRKFAFIQANQAKSIESKERFDAFRKALAKNDLPFDENLTFDSLFTAGYTYDLFKKKFKSKEAINFDVLFSANDFMAIGARRYLQKIGVKIPEDVKIIGFDNTSLAEMSVPKLTTVDQNIYGHGYKAAELMEEVMTKENLPLKKDIEALAVYRQSCGCSHETKKEKSQKELRYFTNGEYSNYLTELDQLYSLMDVDTACDSTEKFFQALSYLVTTINLSALAVCLYDKPVTFTKDSDFVVPEKARLSMICDITKNISLLKPGVYFNPRERIFPGNYFNDFSNNIMVHLLFAGDYNYGYLICALKDEFFSIYCLLLKTMANIVSHLYEITLSFDENKKLKENNSTLAIQSIAEILKETFWSNDIVGRLSGDEFAFLAIGMIKEQIPRINQKVDEYCQKFTEEKNLPFKLSCSIGGAAFSKENNTISKLLTEADKELYKEKQIKHSMR